MLTEDRLYEKFNNQLYQMCKRNFKHSDQAIVYMKSIIIGRTYSVSPERYKGSTTKQKELFWKIFSEEIFRSKIDIHFSKLIVLNKKGVKSLTKEEVEKILLIFEEVHGIFKNACKVQSGRKRPNRISFTSKYLHFHFPNLFFIYDSRAKTGLATHTSNYSIFYKRCLETLKENPKFRTPRELDSFLLGFK